MLQTSVAVVEREASVKGLVDLHFGAGEAETTRLLGNLEATTLPLHDIVVADDAFMHEQQIRSRLSGTARQADCFSRGCLAKRRL